MIPTQLAAMTTPIVIEISRNGNPVGNRSETGQNPAPTASAPAP